MNIFMLHSNPKINAESYCDRHLVKMILESVQILSTVSNEFGGAAPYKPTHLNHPSTQWVLQSGAHWDMLVNLVEALNNEYKFRYNKLNNHKSYDVMLTIPKPNYTNNKATGYFNAVVDEVKIVNAKKCIEEYRKYYVSKSKEIKMTWKNREVPQFIKEVKDVSI